MPISLSDLQTSAASTQRKPIERVVQIFQLVAHRQPTAYNSVYQDLFDELREIAKSSLNIPYEELVNELRLADVRLKSQAGAEMRDIWKNFSVLALIETRYEWMCLEEKKITAAVLTQKSPLTWLKQNVREVLEYQDMVTVELEALESALDLQSVSSLAFVGGGALPLSAIFIALSTPPTVTMTVYDIDMKASSLGRQCAEKLGARNIQFKTMDIADECENEIDNYDAIWLANMVHPESRKKFLRSMPLLHTSLVVRIVKGASRSILRPPVDNVIFDGFQVVSKAKDHQNVFYASHILQRSQPA